MRLTTGLRIAALGISVGARSVRLLCHADLDAGAPTETARGCMVLKEYTLVQKDQAEEGARSIMPLLLQRSATPDR